MIYILWATLRPQAFNQMHTMWIERADDKDDIKSIVLVDTEVDKELLKIPNQHEVIVHKPKQIGVCEPAYKLSSSINPDDTDIIVFASDDFLAPDSWDTYLIEKLKDKSGGLFVRDGYQNPTSSNMLHAAITIPIMTGDCLKRMNNIIYHPAYNHMFSDCELFRNLKDLDMLIDDRINDTTMFEHHHYAAGKRNADTNDQAYNAKWSEDEITWKHRQTMDVEKRILI